MSQVKVTAEEIKPLSEDEDTERLLSYHLLGIRTPSKAEIARVWHVPQARTRDYFYEVETYLTEPSFSRHERTPHSGIRESSRWSIKGKLKALPDSNIFSQTGIRCTSSPIPAPRK